MAEFLERLRSTAKGGNCVGFLHSNYQYGILVSLLPVPCSAKQKNKKLSIPYWYIKLSMILFHLITVESTKFIAHLCNGLPNPASCMETRVGVDSSPSSSIRYQPRRRPDLWLLEFNVSVPCLLSSFFSADVATYQDSESGR